MADFPVFLSTIPPGIEDGVIATFEMYEIIVGRELRDEESIGVTPDFAADANRDESRRTISSAAGWTDTPFAISCPS